MQAKDGLLIWCKKKTAGYKVRHRHSTNNLPSIFAVCDANPSLLFVRRQGVDPPSISGFTTDWKNGLAFCALIHRHFPDVSISFQRLRHPLSQIPYNSALAWL